MVLDRPTSRPPFVPRLISNEPDPRLSRVRQLEPAEFAQRTAPVEPCQCPHCAYHAPRARLRRFAHHTFVVAACLFIGAVFVGGAVLWLTELVS